MIHKYKMFGMNIVLDVNSGSVYSVDELTYSLLDLYENGSINMEKAYALPYGKTEIDEACEEISELVREGVLFSEDWHKNIALKPKPINIKALCLHVAHDCNLRCAYCFANKGDYSGPKGLMSLEIGKKAIDFVIKSSGKRRNIEIDFFGGEPLLNFDVVCKILEYAEEEGAKHGKTFRFTITTNGVLLNDNIKEYVNKKMSNIVLSIDGRPEVNDRMRQRLDGSGTYDRIMPLFTDMAESRGQDNYYVRGTFTGYNLDFSKDVLHLADQGFKQISIEPAVTDPSEPYAITEADLPKIFEEYETLAGEMVKRKKTGRGFNFFHFMIDLTGGPCAIKRISGCGAGHEYVAITPEGDIYPCHQFVGKPEYKMGSVVDDTFDPALGHKMAALNLYTKDACRDCWARFYCSGGCAATSENYSGGMDKPLKLACEMERKRVECAIAMKLALTE